MPDITREEIDAKLEANEARRDAQIASIKETATLLKKLQEKYDKHAAHD